MFYVARLNLIYFEIRLIAIYNNVLKQVLYKNSQLKLMKKILCFLGTRANLQIRLEARLNTYTRDHVYYILWIFYCIEYQMFVTYWRHKESVADSTSSSKLQYNRFVIQSGIISNAKVYRICTKWQADVILYNAFAKQIFHCIGFEQLSFGTYYWMWNILSLKSQISQRWYIDHFVLNFLYLIYVLYLKFAIYLY